MSGDHVVVHWTLMFKYIKFLKLDLDYLHLPQDPPKSTKNFILNSLRIHSRTTQKNFMTSFGRGKQNRTTQKATEMQQINCQLTQENACLLVPLLPVLHCLQILHTSSSPGSRQEERLEISREWRVLIPSYRWKQWQFQSPHLTSSVPPFQAVRQLPAKCHP